MLWYLFYFYRKPNNTLNISAFIALVRYYRYLSYSPKVAIPSSDFFLQKKHFNNYLLHLSMLNPYLSFFNYSFLNIKDYLKSLSKVHLVGIFSSYVSFWVGNGSSYFFKKMTALNGVFISYSSYSTKDYFFNNRRYYLDKVFSCKISNRIQSTRRGILNIPSCDLAVLRTSYFLNKSKYPRCRQICVNITLLGLFINIILINELHRSFYNININWVLIFYILIYLSIIFIFLKNFIFLRK